MNATLEILLNRKSVVRVILERWLGKNVELE
jgi:hypothetical protein